MKKQTSNRVVNQLLIAQATLTPLSDAMLLRVKGGGGAQPPDGDPPPSSSGPGTSGTGH